MRYSVIDISSSGISYIVADAADDGSTSAEIILKDRIYLGLSFFMDGNILTDEGIDKLCDCLKTARDTCARIGVQRCVVVSTASLRNVTNSEEAESEIMRRLGLYVNYIDGETEAYCDYVANVFYAGMDNPVLIDVGGKSMEICDLRNSDKDDMTCLEFGLLDLRARFVSGDNPTPDEAEEIKKFVRYKFDDANLPDDGVYKTAVLIGATCGAIYDVYQAFSKNQPKNGPKVMDRKAFKKMVKFLISDSGRSRLMLSVAPERLALIVPACIVLRNLFKRFDVDTIIVSDRGVKEGYLSMLLSESGDIMVNELGESAGGFSGPETDMPHDNTEASETEDAPAAEEDSEVFITEDGTETEDAPAAEEDHAASEVETVVETPAEDAPAAEEDSEVFITEDGTEIEDVPAAEEDHAASEVETVVETPAEDAPAAEGDLAVKRGRGRPRKTPAPGEGDESGADGTQVVKRGRGRPRKNPDEIVVKVGTGKRGRPRKYPLEDTSAADSKTDVGTDASEPGWPAGPIAPEEGSGSAYGENEFSEDGSETILDDGGSEPDAGDAFGFADADAAFREEQDHSGDDRTDESIQFTMDDFVAGDGSVSESEDEFESELDEPVAPYGDAADASGDEEPPAGVPDEPGAVFERGDEENLGAKADAETPKPEPVEAGSGDDGIAVAGEDEAEPVPAENEARVNEGAEEAAPVRVRETRKKSDVGDSVFGAAAAPKRNAKDTDVEETVAETDSETYVTPAASEDVPPLDEEYLSNDFSDRGIAPFEDASDEATDESFPFADVDPMDDAEDLSAEPEEDAKPSWTDFDTPGLSGMTDMDENFSPFSSDGVDFADKDDDEDV